MNDLSDNGTTEAKDFQENRIPQGPHESELNVGAGIGRQNRRAGKPRNFNNRIDRGQDNNYCCAELQPGHGSIISNGYNDFKTRLRSC